MSKENHPFLEDVYSCSLCGRKAVFKCANCGAKYCKNCVLKRHGKPENNRYCPRCLCKVTKIPLRWIGSTSKMPKFHGATMRKHSEAPYIQPRSDRKKVMERNSNA